MGGECRIAGETMPGILATILPLASRATTEGGRGAARGKLRDPAVIRDLLSIDVPC